MFASSVSLAGTPPATAWDTHYGGSKDMPGSQVWQTEDDGFIVVGYGPDASNTGTNLYLTKFDWKGNQVWSKDIGGWTGDSVRQTSDGGYIATGTVSDDLYLVKTDINGNKQWEKTFKSGSQVRGYAVLPADNGYIVVGQVAAGGTSEWDGYLLKIDMSGNKQWDKVISTNGDYYGDDLYYSIWQTSDGGYILGGLVNFGNNPKPSLVKVDAGGNVQWNKSYEGEDKWDNFNGGWCGIQQTRDGGFIYAGAINDKPYLLKTDANGNKQWSKSYNYITADANAVQQTWDDGYILTGYYSNPDQDAASMNVIRTDANGNEQWRKTFTGIKYAEGNSVLQIGNGSFVAAGWTNEDEGGYKNIYLVQIDRDMTPVPNAKLVSDTVPSVMEAGKAYTVQATFENTGTMPWTFQDETTFGHHGDAVKFGVTGANQTIQIGKVIRPGQSETFAFTMTAPGENGTYNPRFQMMWEGHNPFGALDNKTVRVVNGTGPEAPTVGPTSQATAQPTASAAPTQSQATTGPTTAPTKESSGLPCLSSVLLPLIVVGAVTVSLTVRHKRGSK